MKRPEYPMQPVVFDDATPRVARFKKNKIVTFLLDWASERGCSLNTLALMPFDREDWEQFAQLIGYSVSGAGDLSYKEVIALADAEVEKLCAEQPAKPECSRNR